MLNCQFKHEAKKIVGLVRVCDLFALLLWQQLLTPKRTLRQGLVSPASTASEGRAARKIGLSIEDGCRARGHATAAMYSGIPGASVRVVCT